MSPWAGTPPSQPEYSGPGRDKRQLGRHTSSPAGPIPLLLRLGRSFLCPAGPPGRAPAGPSSRLPRLGQLLPDPDWACLPVWAGLPVGGLGRLPPRLGLEPVVPAGLPGRPLPGFLLRCAPVGPDQEDPARPGLSSGPPPVNPGWAGIPLAQAGLPFPRPEFLLAGRIITLIGRNSPPPAYFTHPASTPTHGASPGTPPGSDWHILHHHMLVLGRPLAQTSISFLS
jgi:hypothetical protein